MGGHDARPPRYIDYTKAQRDELKRRFGFGHADACLLTLLDNDCHGWRQRHQFAPTERPGHFRPGALRSDQPADRQRGPALDADVTTGTGGWHPPAAALMPEASHC
jgi:hypothetical protein